MSYLSDHYRQASASTMYTSVDMSGQGHGGGGSNGDSMIIGQYPVQDVPFTNQSAFQSTFTPSGFSFDSPFISNNPTTNTYELSQEQSTHTTQQFYQQQRQRPQDSMPQPCSVPHSQTPQLGLLQTSFSYPSTPSLISDSSPHSRHTSSTISSHAGSADTMVNMGGMQDGAYNGVYQQQQQQQDPRWNCHVAPMKADTEKKGYPMLQSASTNIAGGERFWQLLEAKMIMDNQQPESGPLLSDSNKFNPYAAGYQPLQPQSNTLSGHFAQQPSAQTSSNGYISSDAHAVDNTSQPSPQLQPNYATPGASQGCFSWNLLKGQQGPIDVQGAGPAQQTTYIGTSAYNPHFEARPRISQPRSLSGHPGGHVNSTAFSTTSKKLKQSPQLSVAAPGVLQQSGGYATRPSFTANPHQTLAQSDSSMSSPVVPDNHNADAVNGGMVSQQVSSNYLIPASGPFPAMVVGTSALPVCAAPRTNSPHSQASNFATSLPYPSAASGTPLSSLEQTHGHQTPAAVPKGSKYTQRVRLSSSTRLSALSPRPNGQEMSVHCDSVGNSTIKPDTPTAQPPSLSTPASDATVRANTSVSPHAIQPGLSSPLKPLGSPARSAVGQTFSVAGGAPPLGIERKRKASLPLARGSVSPTDTLSRQESDKSRHAASGDDVGEPKMVIACYRCRSKKLKCDGAKPKCHHCARHDESCEFDATLRRRGPGKNNKGKGSRSAGKAGRNSATNGARGRAASSSMSTVSAGSAAGGVRNT